MKEIFLLKNNTEAAESLHQYNMTVAAPLELRIENLRCDKGGEYTGQEFRTLCVGAGINIEYTATNTPQQNGVSERDGQTLAKITRCLMKDGDFPPFMWGELVFTATYLANRSPHSTLKRATPYSKMHNLERTSRAWAPSEPEHSSTVRLTPRSWKTGPSRENCADTATTARRTASTIRPKVRSWIAGTSPSWKCRHALYLRMSRRKTTTTRKTLFGSRRC